MDEGLRSDVVAGVRAAWQPDMPLGGLFGFVAWFRGVLAEDPANAVLRDVVVDEVRKHLQAHPDAHRARFLLGLLYYEYHALDHAIECFQESRKDRELVLQSYRFLGRCFSEKVGFNMEDLAMKQYRKGIETRGFAVEEYNDLRYELAHIYARRNENGAACDLFRQVHAIDPRHHDVQKWVDWCNRGRGEDDGNAPVPLTTVPRPPAASIALDLPEDEKPVGE